MMADHGELCNGEDATYCMNGGTCYNIISMNTLSCVCNEKYKGSRCEQFHLSRLTSPDGTEAGLIAAVVIVALLILVVLAVVIYYIRGMLKAKQQSQQNNPQQYWRVKPRV